MKLVCWALQDKRGRFVQHDAVVHFEAMRTVTFRSRKEAFAWLAQDRFWLGKAVPVRVKITVQEI